MKNELEKVTSKEEAARLRKQRLAELKERLNSYLINAVKAGKTPNQIKKELIAAGWPKSFIDKYCKKYFSKYKEIKVTKRFTEKSRDIMAAEMEKLDAELKKLG